VVFCDANYVCELNCKMGFEHMWCNFKFARCYFLWNCDAYGVLLQGFANSFQVDEITYKNTYMRFTFVHAWFFLFTNIIPYEWDKIHAGETMIMKTINWSWRNDDENLEIFLQTSIYGH
jgi:hypothetical protein